MKVGYYLFGRTSLNYGLSYIAHKGGINMERATEKTIKYFDVVCFSIYWFQHVIEFVCLCNKLKIGKKYGSKPRLIIGGFNTFNPVIFKPYAHAICVGDGDDVFRELIVDIEYQHPSIYHGNEETIEYCQADISNNSFVYYNESRIARIEIARGCKYRCKFCQLAVLKKYREVSFPAIERAVKNSIGNRLVLFAPNKTSHSESDRIKQCLIDNGKQDACPDVRFNEVNKFYGSNHMQIGIEGISERLRFMVGKHLTNESLREIIKNAIEKQLHMGYRPAITFGYILDLPSECEADWMEFAGFLDSLSEIENSDKLNVFFIFNLFQPLPFTAFEDEVVHLGMNYTAKIKRALYDRKFKICVRGRLFSDSSRLLSAIATRGDENSDEDIMRILASKKAMNDNKQLRRYEEILKNRGGLQCYIGKPINKPWRIINIG